MAAFTIYGSLVPFRLATPADAGLGDRVRAVLRTPPAGRISRANVLANVLLGVPLGFAVTGALLVDRRARRLAVPAAVAALACGLALAAGVEFLQTFLRDRVPSWVDVAAQTTGCAIGAAAWLLGGRRATAWLRGGAGDRPGGAAARALTLYAAAWAFVSLAPFDATLDPAHLRQRIAQGLITVVPFGNPDVSGWRLAWEVFATAISAVPIGALFAVGKPRTAAAGVSAWAAALALIAGIELAQAFIRSHAADTGDLLSAAAGAAAGIWGARRVAAADRGGQVFTDRHRGALRAALAGWALVAIAYHWMPFDVAVDQAAIQAKLSRLSFVPFSGYWSGSYLRALNDLLVKLALAMPLGVLGALSFRWRTPMALLAIAAGGVCLFTLAEAGQLLIPSRIPEPTDVLIGTSGAVLGASLTRALWPREAPVHPP